MQKQEQLEFRKRLLEMRSRLRDEIQRSIDTVAEEVNPPGEDYHEPVEGLDKELAVEHAQEDIHNAIEAALERIEAGTFGTCLDCGREIPRERLEAIPYTPVCVDCERKREASA